MMMFYIMVFCCIISSILLPISKKDKNDPVLYDCVSNKNEYQYIPIIFSFIIPLTNPTEDGIFLEEWPNS